MAERTLQVGASRPVSERAKADAMHRAWHRDLHRREGLRSSAVEALRTNIEFTTMGFTMVDCLDHRIFCTDGSWIEEGPARSAWAITHVGKSQRQEAYIGHITQRHI